MSVPDQAFETIVAEPLANGDHRAVPEGLRVRFLGRSPRREAVPYVLHEPYGEARSKLLSRRPAPEDDTTARPFGRLFAIVADLGLDDYLVSVYLFADGTISIYSSVGIHSTGLRGAPKVAEAATAIFEEVEQTLGEFSPVEDLGLLPLPDRGHSQILVRAYDGDFAASDRLDQRHAMVATLAAMALLLTRLARSAIVEGFDRVEAGEVRYWLTPEYRSIRSTLLDWLPASEQLPAATRVASVAVEIGEAETETVTSLFAFADGSTSLYRSDGTLMKGLSETPGIADAARALLESIELALSAFGPAGLISLPQPGRVQFVARARLDENSEWSQLLAVASREALAGGLHPLSAAFDRANEVLRIAG
jgi:hypothetical protein